MKSDLSHIAEFDVKVKEALAAIEPTDENCLNVSYYFLVLAATVLSGRNGSGVEEFLKLARRSFEEAAVHQQRKVGMPS